MFARSSFRPVGQACVPSSLAHWAQQYVTPPGFGPVSDDRAAAAGAPRGNEFDLEQNAWTELEIEGPSASGWDVMAADAESGTIVLIGGRRLARGVHG